MRQSATMTIKLSLEVPQLEQRRTGPWIQQSCPINTNYKNVIHILPKGIFLS